MSTSRSSFGSLSLLCQPMSSLHHHRPHLAPTQSVICEGSSISTGFAVINNTTSTFTAESPPGLSYVHSYPRCARQSLTLYCARVPMKNAAGCSEQCISEIAIICNITLQCITILVVLCPLSQSFARTYAFAGLGTIPTKVVYTSSSRFLGRTSSSIPALNPFA